MPGIVLDTGIFLQAAISRTGPAAGVLRLAERGAVTLYTSDALLDEVRDVLTRPAIRRKNPRYSDQDIENLVRFLEVKGIRVAEMRTHFQYQRDPDDEYLVNLAIEAGAKYLVSRDKDLLDLMDENTPAGKAFRRRFPGLTILDPVALLRALSPRGEGTPP